MKTLIEELTDELTTNAHIEFGISDGYGGEELNHRDEGDEDFRPTQKYTDSPLTENDISTMDGWLEDDYLQDINDDLITNHLDEILILLVSIRGRACGKELLQDLRRIFGTDLSVGTVYPHLNSLADEDILEISQLPKRKVYCLKDREETVSKVENKADELFIFTLVLKAMILDQKLGECEVKDRGDKYE